MDTLLHTALGKIVLPMVTPFRFGAIDLEAAQRLAVHYVEAGISGLVLFGSTGEGNLVTVDEQANLLKAVRECVDVPILVGVGGVDTHRVVATIKRLDRCAPSAYLVPPPYYLRPAQAGIIWHYTTISTASATPLVLYDIAARTGCAMTVQTMETLYALPTVAGAKVCDARVLAALHQRATFPVFCGEDRALLPHLYCGGAISAAAHIRPDLFVRLASLARQGRTDEAQALFKHLRSLIRLVYAEPNPAPVKAYLARFGLIANELREPMMPASRDINRQIGRLVEHLRDI